MAFIVLVVNLPNDTITGINQDVQLPTKVEESIQGAIQQLIDIQAGTKPGVVQITSRDTDPGVSTSGSGSLQATYNHL
jgi:hypothetical protein